ncbi:MAG: rRNA maturation RNase YbeY [Actinomycetota bacterium]
MSTDDDLEIVGFDRTSTGVTQIDRWTGVAAATLRGESISRGRLDVIFVDDAEMAELNLTHMGHEGPTDVLSFPLDGEESGALDEPDDIFANLPDAAADGEVFDGGDDPPLHLGDLVICPNVAERQAPTHAGSIDAEMTLLIIHGTLHILGHDHADQPETDVMQGRERVHMKAAGFEHPRWAGCR